MKRSDLSILFLPSGPGLNSAPAKLFLQPVFDRLATSFFWNEPSLQRGQIIPDDPRQLWELTLDSLESAVDSLPGKVAVITESFGSVMAEALYARLIEKKKEGRIAGILHSPPVLDTRKAFLKILYVSEFDFRSTGNVALADELRQLITLAQKGSHLADPSLLEAITIAFSSSSYLPRYFREISKIGHWASAFAQEGFAPEPEMRGKVLAAIDAVGGSAKTEFAPDIYTWVCGGEFDPYQTLTEFEQAIHQVNLRPGRKNLVTWIPIAGTSHYPFVDVPLIWERDVLLPFWNECLARLKNIRDDHLNLASFSSPTH